MKPSGINSRLWKVGTGIAIALILVALILAVPAGPAVLGAARHAALEIRLEQIQTALLSYNTEYYIMPPATDNASLIREITGDNPRHIPFAIFKTSDLNTAGELLDPWGTPLRVTRDAVHFHITSAGSDKVFGTADDVQANVELDPTNAVPHR